jgi:Zn-finger nucleic acid-binding protein
MPPSYSNSNDSVVSISSKTSKNSKKKRTIDGVHHDSHHMPPAYSFRRTDSNSSSTSTMTAGNNTSVDTHMTEDSPHKRGSASELPALSLAGMSFDEHDSHHRQPLRRYHHRDFSADASTASSLSVGGFSLSSYDGPRVGALGDGVLADRKRHKGSRIETLLVDTSMRPPSVLGNDESSRFEQLSLDPSKMPTSNTSSASGESKDRNLFLSFSTSPINTQGDIDQTPISKNTKKASESNSNVVSGIFKKRGDTHRKLDSALCDAPPSDTPTPPVHGEMGDNAMTDDHGMLDQHLRGQSFTPLPHLSASNGGESTGDSPSNAGIVPQLSWDLAGDTPSLADLADWEEDTKSKSASRPNSTTSTGTRHIMLSPHDFQLWKDEGDLGDQAIGGTTTPLPAFFGNESSENYKEEHMNPMYTGSSRHPGYPHKMMVHPGSWHKHHEHDMPPTPMFSTDFRDHGFARSPHDGDRRDGMDFYNPYPYGHHASNDRIRNLRGRLPPNVHMPPMPLHIHPGMPSHLPMTSPMGLGQNKGMWSPHGMPHSMGSPHHMGSPMGNMAQSKRSCVAIKPPIPTKFQGDIEKAKNASVPEFTGLVNFPAHISQKQSANLPEGMRCCVMCGAACPCSTITKGSGSKKGGAPAAGKKGSDGGLAPRSSNGQTMMGDGKGPGYAIIPTQNKGLCTLCDVNVWIVVQSGLEIKWCKGCKNFRPWAAFGDKGLATKCLRCRERQREKYAYQKEEKTKGPEKSKKSSDSCCSLDAASN